MDALFILGTIILPFIARIFPDPQGPCAMPVDCADTTGSTTRPCVSFFSHLSYLGAFFVGYSYLFLILDYDAMSGLLFYRVSKHFFSFSVFLFVCAYNPKILHFAKVAWYEIKVQRGLEFWGWNVNYNSACVRIKGRDSSKVLPCRTVLFFVTSHNKTWMIQLPHQVSRILDNPGVLLRALFFKVPTVCVSKVGQSSIKDL